MQLLIFSILFSPCPSAFGVNLALPFEESNRLFLVLWLLHSYLVNDVRWGSFTQKWKEGQITILPNTVYEFLSWAFERNPTQLKFNFNFFEKFLFFKWLSNEIPEKFLIIILKYSTPKSLYSHCYKMVHFKLLI